MLGHFKYKCLFVSLVSESERERERERERESERESARERERARESVRARVRESARERERPRRRSHDSATSVMSRTRTHCSARRRLATFWRLAWGEGEEDKEQRKVYS